MEFLLKLLSEQSVVIVLTFWIGGWAKRQAWFANKFIPVLTYICSLLGLTLAPTSANAFSLGGTLSGAGNVFLAAALQNLLVTGGHSTYKNTLKPAFWSVVKFFVGKLEKKAAVDKTED